MIAIAKIGGHQELVQVGDKLEVDKLDAEVGKTVSFDVLLVSEPDGKDFKVGKPFIEGIKVEAKILEQGRGEKIRVYKMKPRKRYRRNLGHRQDYTAIEIVAIKTGAPKKSAAKPVAEKAADKPATKAAPKTAIKKPAAKKTAAKKPAAKKAPAKK